MKLIRFGDPGAERCGVILGDGRNVDVSAAFENYDEAFFAGDGLGVLARWLQDNHRALVDVPEGVRFGCPIGRPSKVLGLGLNYRDQVQELRVEMPKEPVFFFKASSSVMGPYDDLIIPNGSMKTDWEVELGVVIGMRARRVTIAEAMEYVVGYVVVNDYSERDWQLKGKHADTFAPMGPCLVTQDEIGDPHELGLWLTVNGELKQEGSTRNLIFRIPYLVHYLSQFMTLLPGDVLCTGTPAGTAMGRKERFLKPGDLVELGVDGLGSQRQIVTAELV